MKIRHVEIQNFRKLKCIRIDFEDETTVFVGANNSGKTSAIIALSQFLVEPSNFNIKDFTISNWPSISAIGDGWVNNASTGRAPSLDERQWERLCPSMDVWLEVSTDEVHHVRHLIPTLDWSSGLIGVRLLFGPKGLGELQKDFVFAARNAREMLQDAKSAANGQLDGLDLWPKSLVEFIERLLHSHFGLHAFLLDPTKLVDPEKGIARPQVLPEMSEVLEVAPFDGLIKINKVEAHRGFSDAENTPGRSRGRVSNETTARFDGSRLSDQMRRYYMDHINPASSPEPSDLEALQAIQAAQKQFDLRLRDGFSAALTELEDLGYPGITDPKITIATKLRPEESINHRSAVQYDVPHSDADTSDNRLRLPEQYIGLGYQNLISIVFRLMSYRDAWMQVGKAAKQPSAGTRSEYSPPPIHLVVVEEPEAHLHAQVQQVFIRKAYSVLRNHQDLKENAFLSTQLIVSTHSSHIAHESDFSSLRYFRRLPAGEAARVPVSAVVNLSDVFGAKDPTARFVARYLKATHSDLFFADAAILVEGSAERMLIPHFIRNAYRDLHTRYVTLLEIGGSHAHRFQPLIEKLHLPTLIIADIDPARDKRGKPKASPARNSGLITRNPTLTNWLPRIRKFDALLDLSPQEKVVIHDSLFSVCIAYQRPVKVNLTDGGHPSEAIATTFEDALAIENLRLLRSSNGTGLIKKFREAIREASTVAELEARLRSAIKVRQKAQFALDLLFLDDAEALRPPLYIADGLDWLQRHLIKTKVERLYTSTSSTTKSLELEASDADG